ncbi:MAG: RecX family transcriptional regulator [Alphaproteobacteria bacterium]
MPRTRSAPDDGVGSERTIDAALLEDWALSYLGRYASTAENLRQVLRRRVRRRLAAGQSGDREDAAAAEPLIDALIARCRETGLVNDTAYAASRARHGVARGRSLRRIAAGLAAKGVGAADTAAAIASLRDETTDPDLAAAIAFARRRRLGPFRTRPDPRKTAVLGDAELHRSELAALARAGFPRRTAEAVLACPDHAAVQALLADDARQAAPSRPPATANSSSKPIPSSPGGPRPSKPAAS